jgi:hypothetical protein
MHRDWLIAAQGIDIPLTPKKYRGKRNIFPEVGGILRPAVGAFHALASLQTLTPTGTEHPLPLSRLALSPRPQLGNRRYGTHWPLPWDVEPGTPD